MELKWAATRRFLVALASILVILLLVVDPRRGGAAVVGFLLIGLSVGMLATARRRSREMNGPP